MARIKNGEVRGKIKSENFGDVVLYGQEGDTMVRSKGAPRKPQNDLQMWHKVKVTNIVHTYKKLQPIISRLWDERAAERKANGKAKGNSYSRFMKANLEKRGCAIWPKWDDAGGCVAVPYQLSDGLLEPIKIVPLGKDGKPEKHTVDDCPRARTNIRIGSLVVDEKTTVGDFAQAIIEHNNVWDWGDTLLYVQMEQTIREVEYDTATYRYPCVTARIWPVPLENEERLLKEVADLRWVQNTDGYVGHGEETPIGGFCWVHLRGVLEPETETALSEEEIQERVAEMREEEEEDAYLIGEGYVVPNVRKRNKKRALPPLECSRQDMVCNNREIIAEHRDEKHVREVIELHRAHQKVPAKKRAVAVRDVSTEKSLDWGM